MEHILTYLRWGNYKPSSLAEKGDKETIFSAAARVRERAKEVTTLLQNPDFTRRIIGATRGKRT